MPKLDLPWYTPGVAMPTPGRTIEAVHSTILGDQGEPINESLGTFNRDCPAWRKVFEQDNVKWRYPSG